MAEKLINKLPKRPIHFAKQFLKDYYQEKGVVENYFHFLTVGEEEIENLLNGLTASKATGLDSLRARFLKDGAEVIACPLAHIINLSLHSSQIPEDMKNARVVPLYEKQSKTEPGSYRPVSILSVTSKILERIVYNQLEHYLKEKNLVYKLQSGFRPSFSTGTCFTFLMDYIRSEMDFGNYIGMVMIDLQKAFDTVDHSILENKLKAIGLDGNAIAWFDAYLTNRMQVTDVGGIFSDPKVVPCGVPQGSILGPLVFLIYVNDMEASKTVIRYLGVDLEQTLSGTAIVENILKKVNSRLKFLYRQAKYLNTRSRKLSTSALILCHFEYACSAWYSGIQKTMKHKRQILQNKTMRLALDLSPRTHLDITHFLKMQWLPVDVRVEQLNLNIMHRIVHGGAPCYLTESFGMVSQVHDVETRHRTLSVSLPSTGRNGSKAFKLNGMKSLSKLPLKIKKLNSLAPFKEAVRLYLIDRLVSEYNSDFLYY